MYSFESCRICLQNKPEQNLKPTSSVNPDDGVIFLEHLKYCVNEVNWSSDDFPSLLCEDCIKDLQNTSKFKFRCVQSSLCRQKYITDQSDLNKPTVVDFLVKSIEEVKEEPIETNDNNNCDIETKVDIDDIKIECSVTTECIEKQEKSVSKKQKKVNRVYPSYIDVNKCFCSLCNRTFIRKSSIWRHVRNIHISNTKSKEKAIFPSYIDKDCDTELKIEVGETKVACNQTNESIEKQEKKPKKAKRVFPSYIDKDKSFCNLCNRTYVRKLLWRHIQNVHTSEKNYKCDVCSKAFTTSARLKIHNVKHTGKRDYVCYVCGKMFQLLDHLKCHLERHENKKKHQCDVCGKFFNLRTAVYIHKQRVHADRENWKHLCTQCGKKFVSRSLLDVHVKRVHLKLKEHACSLCEKKFVTKAEVEAHRLKHSNVRLNKCEICGTEYKRKEILTRHLKKVHDIVTASA